jgi:hypothetical protein
MRDSKPKTDRDLNFAFHSTEETLIVFNNTNEGLAEIETAETCDCD